ncbi:MAG: hypothetical protein EPO32_12835 [Anaerolineae bacterium]|nr:MAG: hypothetical protein EPO32_12835 [Anaerolineae bacterium]
MASPYCERAINDALRNRTALLKFISANDVDLTGAHQAGFYLPKGAAGHFSPNPPDKGYNADHPVMITWPDGIETQSMVKWYGKGTRSEYRITRFGNDFPWRTSDNLGSLLVLIPETIDKFIAYVLDLDDDIFDIQIALGIEVYESWALYEQGAESLESEDECINRLFREIAAGLSELPSGQVFSDSTRKAIFSCTQDFANLSPDLQLMRFIREEYTLYKMAERRVFQSEVTRLFASIDDFLMVAQKILQARKSRSGRSLENHVEFLLQQEGIPYQMRQTLDGTRPDIVIPGKEQYDDMQFPADKLFIVGVKRTCRDRWRQVLNEARRVERKHILTLQEGISSPQLQEMRQAGVCLIVPESLHKQYPKEDRTEILTIQGFLNQVAELYPNA